MFRYFLFLLLYICPVPELKTFFYRSTGMSIGKNVYIAPTVYIDVINPALIEIKDNVMIGMGVSLIIHERTLKTFTIGRIKIGYNVSIGGSTLIRNGVSIGDNAELDSMLNITKNVRTDETIIHQRNK